MRKMTKNKRKLFGVSSPKLCLAVGLIWKRKIEPDTSREDGEEGGKSTDKGNRWEEVAIAAFGQTNMEHIINI